MLTAGCVRLSELLKPKAMSQTELARQLDVSPQAVSGWVSGKTKPGPDLMAKLEDLLGIPMRAWTEPSEEEGAA